MESMTNIIQSMKKDFRVESKLENFKECGLQAVFNIGSVANAKFFDEFDQDFDIHFYFDKIEIGRDCLDGIKKTFKNIIHQHEDENIAIEFAIKDRPWKMVSIKQKNIGIHGTILNLLDFKRRVNQNYILALNMFQNAEVLEGRLNYPQKEITSEQFLFEVGGTGWLKELFYRSLVIIDIDNKKFYPVINEFCYYFAMSPLLHLYYFYNKEVNTRKRCYEFFVNSKEVPESLRDKVKFIYDNRYNIFDGPNDYIKLMDYTIDAINYVHNLFIKQSRNSTIHNETISNKKPLVIDEDSKLISEILGMEINICQRHYLINNENIYTSKLELSQIIKKLKNPKTNDYVDVVYDVISNELEEVDRVYFWSVDNLNRLFNKIDFNLEDEQMTKSYLLNSWEKGITSFIQQLNEIYINNEEIRPPHVKLAKILLIISYKNYLKLQNSVAYPFQEIVEIMREKENINLEKIDKSSYTEQYFSYLRALCGLAEKLTSYPNG